MGQLLESGGAARAVLPGSGSMKHKREPVPGQRGQELLRASKQLALGMSAGCRKAGTVAPTSAPCACQVSMEEGAAQKSGVESQPLQAAETAAPERLQSWRQPRSQLLCSLTLSHAPSRTDCHHTDSSCALTCDDRPCCDALATLWHRSLQANRQLRMHSSYWVSTGGSRMGALEQPGTPAAASHLGGWCPLPHLRLGQETLH